MRIRTCTNAFTLVEILVALAILTSAIIPIVTVINHYGRETGWNEYYSFALSLGSNALKNVEQLNIRELKKVMGPVKKASYSGTIRDQDGNVLLDLDEVGHKSVKYRQKLEVQRIYPEFRQYKGTSDQPVRYDSKHAMYVFEYSIHWTGKNNRKQELNFEYFKGDI